MPVYYNSNVTYKKENVHIVPMRRQMQTGYSMLSYLTVTERAQVDQQRKRLHVRIRRM